MILLRMNPYEQKKALQRSSNIKVAAAFGFLGLIVLIAMIAGKSDAGVYAIIPVGLAAAVFWYWGLGEYARSKGYPSSMAFLGLLGIIGLLVLLILPDQYKVTAPPPVLGETAYPRTAPGTVSTIV